jgi:hypothetical protein
MMAGKNVLLVLIAALLMPACIDDFEQGAVTVTDGGALRVLHHPCNEDDVVFDVSLLVPVGDIVGDENDNFGPTGSPGTIL